MIIETQGQCAVHGRLTEVQRSQIRKHPEQAAERLRAAGVVDEAWLRTVAEHHERAGGGGYPSGLPEPTEYGSVLRMVDVFMAKISPRCGGRKVTIQDAARQMFGEARGSQAAAAIIKEYGIYPPGDFVQLASGELAVVIRRGENARSPSAAAITDNAGMPATTTVRRDTAQDGYAIKALVPERAFVLRLPPERLYGLPADVLKSSIGQRMVNSS